MLDYTLKNFPFNDSIDIADCTLTDLLKSIVGSKGLPDKVAKEKGQNMKKLNNGGWGLVEMLLLSAALLIALLVAAYFIYVLYNSF